MQFANFGLLLGGLLIAIPIVLHLVMRQQPKPFEFPALRFVQRRNVQNQRKLQLKHWILLLLRCLVIALLVLALARPGVASAAIGNWIAVGGLALLGVICGLIALASFFAGDRKLLAYVLAGLAVIMLLTSGGVTAVTLSSEEASFLADQEAPVAAVLVFDTSPRMLYRHQNQTRLERAQEIAEWLIGQFPTDSEVAVIDQRSGGSLFASDVGAARQAVQRLESSVGGESLAELIPRAVQLAEGNELARKEIYLFSDLARPAWEEQGINRVRTALEEAARIPAYLINVGVDDPQNGAIANLALSQESISENSEIILQVEISSDGVASSRTVELMLETQDDTLPRVEDGELITPEASRRNRQTVNLEPGESRMINFRLGGLTPGIHHGWVTLVGEDGLEIDNQRWFSLEVRPPWPMLVVEGNGAVSRDLVNALAPPSYRESGRAAFNIEVIPQSELERKNLETYNLVALLDPGKMPDATWEKLTRFAREGGGVMTFLGRNARLEDMNGESATQLLPGTLASQWRAGDREWYLDPPDYQHQLLSAFREIGTAIAWRDFPVDRHWSFDDLDADANVIVQYSNNYMPALIEQRIGRGVALTFTTSISDGPEVQPWNRLFTGFDSWPFFVLSNQMARYAVQSGDRRVNFTAGDTASLPTEADQIDKTHLLFTPRGTDPQEVTPDLGVLTVPFTNHVGIYRIRPASGGATLGFSVNLPPAATQLAQINEEDIERIFGPDRVQVARETDEIVRQQGQARAGLPLFPMALCLMALVFGLEHLLSNRFYRSQ